MLKRALSARCNKQKGHFLDHGTSLKKLIYNHFICTINNSSKYFFTRKIFFFSFFVCVAGCTFF